MHMKEVKFGKKLDYLSKSMLLAIRYNNDVSSFINESEENGVFVDRNQFSSNLDGVYKNFNNLPNLVQNAFTKYASADDRFVFAVNKSNDNYDIIFKNDSGLSQVEVRFIDSEVKNCKESDNDLIDVMKDYTKNPDNLDIELDEIIVSNKDNGIARIKVYDDDVESGFVADGLTRYFFSSEVDGGVKAKKSLIVKNNNKNDINVHEYEILKEINKDESLKKLGICAPEIYSVGYSKICMEYIDADNVEDIFKDKSISDIKKHDIKNRIIQGTMQVEKIIKSVSKKVDYDGSVDKSKLKSSLDILKKCKSVYQEHNKKKKVDLINRVLNREDDFLENISTDTKSLDERLYSQPMESVSLVGDVHDYYISALDYKGELDTYLSDSRFANWKYDKESDKLFKIDENIALSGSKYSCIARIADFDFAMTESERDVFIKKIVPEKELENAYLSLYFTNLESGIGLKKSGAIDLYEKRLDRSMGYLDRLVKIDAKYEVLQSEFVDNFLQKGSDSRAA